MALAQKKITAILCVLTLASSQAEEPTAPSSSLEAARRDLLALPSTNQSLGVSRQNDLRVDVPNVPNSNSGNEISKPSTALLPANSEGARGGYQIGGVKAPSEGWLVDAFKVADVQARAQRGADDQHFKDRQQIQSKSGGAAALNPFSPYLNQWLSPHDPVLLQITSPNQIAGVSASTKDSSDSLGARAGSGITFTGNGASVGATANPSPFANASTGMQNPAAGGTAVNPYLPPEMNGIGRTNNKPGSGVYWPGTNQPISPGGLNSLPPAGRKPKLAEPAYTPPTAPLIDERKYFPQLHRF